MPVKRRIQKNRPHRITPEAIAAWEAGDFDALHCALGLRPWERSPLPRTLTALGVDQGPPPEWENPQTSTWAMAQNLQRELLEAAGGKMPTVEAPDSE